MTDNTVQDPNDPYGFNKLYAKTLALQDKANNSDIPQEAPTTATEQPKDSAFFSAFKDSLKPSSYAQENPLAPVESVVSSGLDKVGQEAGKVGGGFTGMLSKIIGSGPESSADKKSHGIVGGIHDIIEPVISSPVGSGILNGLKYLAANTGDMGPEMEGLTKILGAVTGNPNASIYEDSTGAGGINNAPNLNNTGYGAGNVSPAKQEDILKAMKNPTSVSGGVVNSGLMSSDLERYNNAQAGIDNARRQYAILSRIPRPNAKQQQLLEFYAKQLKEIPEYEKQLLTNSKLYNEQLLNIDGHLDPNSDLGKNVIESQKSSKLINDMTYSADKAIKNADATELSSLSSMAAEFSKNVTGVVPTAEQREVLDAVSHDAKGFFGLGAGKTINYQNINTFFSTLEHLKNSTESNFNTYADAGKISPETRERMLTGLTGESGIKTQAPKFGNTSDAEGMGHDGNIHRIHNGYVMTDDGKNYLDSAGSALNIIDGKPKMIDANTQFSGKLMPFVYDDPILIAGRTGFGKAKFDKDKNVSVNEIIPNRDHYDIIINKYLNQESPQAQNQLAGMAQKQGNLTQEQAKQEAGKIAPVVKGVVGAIRGQGGNLGGAPSPFGVGPDIAKQFGLGFPEVSTKPTPEDIKQAKEAIEYKRQNPTANIDVKAAQAVLDNAK